ncbi:hypothetical protein [Hyphococcus sp.]|jgi:hypothetical protein|uniref:hypothetical protein n=1 Tax=Hyphococcus sp. TaxID=2038636 RepID=UPI003D09B02B
MSGEDKSLKAALDALKKTQRLENDAQASAHEGGSQKKTRQASPGFAFAPVASLWERATRRADAVWNGWLRPVTRFLTPITKRIISFYRWTFRSLAYKGPKNARVFSRKRAGVAVAALAVFTVIAPFLLVQEIIPAISRTIYDAGMLATMKEDKLYLGRAELINPDRQLYQVMGCRDIKGCDGGDNTTYYRLRDNVILDIKYWTTRFEPYDPAEIAGAMVSELNDCSIRYYGRRSKALGWYPYIVSASCKPVLAG